ncbi:MAG: bacteriohemerythrin [Desulfobacca sp.]|uniref:bacteriohemerythrin n=1 Tax=Desulfobacca sp. TaxID=2067990 RepID=UPI00404B86BD
MPFDWGEKYRLGIPEIDRQHQTLLLLLHKAFDFYAHHPHHLPESALRQRLLQDLHGLREVARAHFATEEALMERYDYPHRGPHCQEHTKLLEIAARFAEKIALSGAFSLTEWIEVILQWYDNHVQHLDREMGEFFRDRI